jgi:hypothetical protein
MSIQMQAIGSVERDPELHIGLLGPPTKFTTLSSKNTAEERQTAPESRKR